MDTKMPFADEYLRVPLNSGAMLRVLQALCGPDHLVRELQVLANSQFLPAGQDNPLRLVIDEFNSFAQDHKGAHYGWVVLPAIMGLNAVFNDGFRFFGHGDRRRPMVYGRRHVAVKATQDDCNRYAPGMIRSPIVRVRLDGLKYREEGDLVRFDEDLEGLEAWRFDGSDIEIIQRRAD